VFHLYAETLYRVPASARKPALLAFVSGRLIGVFDSGAPPPAIQKHRDTARTGDVKMNAILVTVDSNRK
jgi:hypothetical protein